MHERRDPTIDRAYAHRDAYDDFRRRTGAEFRDLEELHRKAIEIQRDDRDRASAGDQSLMNPSRMIVTDPRMFAYLTDLAMQHLAIGASLHHGSMEHALRRHLRKA